MPREVFLAPGGSPFVQNTPFQHHEHSDTDISLPELSSHYFRAGGNPDNLNSSRGLAGLGDISIDMAEDDSPMRFRSSGSDEMLMGVKGGEFLADDSALGFDTSLMSKPFESRSKLNHSTTLPVTVAEEPEPEIEVEQAAKTGKPKRKKSTRSRSKSPSKKSVTPDPVSVAVESGAPFLREPMETTTEVPEPGEPSWVFDPFPMLKCSLQPEPEVVVPEPEVRPRRTSPRKARTRAPSAVEPPVVSNATLAASPFNPFSPPTSELAPPSEPTPQPTQQSPEVSTQPPQSTKSKRTSRSVGRSKSKTRSKDVPAEEDNPQVGGITTSATLVPSIGKEHTSPDLGQSVLPSFPKAADAHKETSPPAAAEDILPPAFVDKYSSIIKTTIPQQQPVHARAESGPVPFKFQAVPSTTKSRSKSLTPAETHTPPVPPTITSTLATPSLDIPASEETPREPTEEEEAEAIASALQILRRDSSIFPQLRQSIAPNYTPTLEPIPSHGNALAAAQEPNQTLVQAEPVHKRTRVGRSSTRVRGGAGITAPGNQARMNQVIEEGRVEASQKPEEAIPELDTLGVGTLTRPNGPVDEADEAGEAELEQELVAEDIVVPVNFGSRTPSPTPVPTSASPPFGTQPGPEPRSAISGTRTGPIPRSRTSTAPNSSPPSSTGPTGMNDAPVKPRAVRASLPVQTTRVSAPTTRAARMSEGRPMVARNVGSARASKPREPELVEEKEDDEKNAEETTGPDLPIVDVSAPTSIPPIGDVVQPAAVGNSVVPSEPVSALEATTEARIDHEPHPEPGLAEDLNTSAPTKLPAQHKALGVSGKGRPQRAAPVASQKAVSTAASKPGARVLSGQRSVSITEKPSVPAPTKTTVVVAPKSSVVALGEGTPPIAESAPASSSSARPQRKVTTSRKPGPTASVTQKPPSGSSQATDTTGPVLNKDAKTSSSRVAAKNKPEAKARPTRTLPKCTAATSRDQTSGETEGNEETALSKQVTDGDKAEAIEQVAKEAITKPTRAGPFEHTHGVFQPILNYQDLNNPLACSEPHTSPPRPNKRCATPEIDPEHQVFDSPSKRVRFSAELEAGPTPRAAPNRVKPKPSLKPFAKPKFRLKVNRPKRTLTRNKPPTDMVPSYAAPLKRTVSAQVDSGVANSERPPLSESRTNARSTTNKLKPTVPVEFTFRSELRTKPPVEVPLPNAIPIALPMPDFAAAHAAAEAANLARRERTQAVFLAAQAELEGWRESKHEIGGETARRAAERAVFDAALRVKEAETERMRLEAKKLEDEREATEIKELRKRMVPKANPVPEWYKQIGQNENRGEGRVETE
ncbi:hypothetical protein FRC10_006212 [Ceratobasidium sp. 414]|nr:hypothetical protein FRC10_006212 [Ceratobasidium sp. 414]